MSQNGHKNIKNNNYSHSDKCLLSPVRIQDCGKNFRNVNSFDLHSGPGNEFYLSPASDGNVEAYKGP